MIVSVETPVFKGKWLQKCIDSVLTQSSDNWTFSLCWDGGDEESRLVLEELVQRNLPNVYVYFEENRGIARARHFLSERSVGDYILPLDDDDVLSADAVERLLACAEEKPWCGIVRGQRKYVDEDGKVVDEEPWFPFEPRHYQHGMITDIFNHSQPYLINRSLYKKTTGWEGFEDFMFAGEDCDVILKLEEQGSIELLDEVLYYYRLNPKRASGELEVEGAHEMWRRLADKSIERIGLPLKRTNDIPPYIYEKLPQPRPEASMIDFVIPHGEGTQGIRQKWHHRRALKRIGVTDDAIHFIELGENTVIDSYIEGFKLTSRPLLCFIDPDVRLTDRNVFETLLSTMHEQSADILGPKVVGNGGAVCSADPYFDKSQLPVSRGHDTPDKNEFSYVSDANWLSTHFLLLRREVLNAVAGFDGGYESKLIEGADFCLKARQRDFKCLYVGTTTVSCKNYNPTDYAPAAITLFHEKWNSHLHLLKDQNGPE